MGGQQERGGGGGAEGGVPGKEGVRGIGPGKAAWISRGLQPRRDVVGAKRKRE